MYRIQLELSAPIPQNCLFSRKNTISHSSMSLITLGINHKTAPLDLRERLAFTPQSLPEALLSLNNLEHV